MSLKATTYKQDLILAEKMDTVPKARPEEWSIDNAQITGVTAFEGNSEFTPIVAEVSTDGLIDAHQRLQLLPHIDVRQQRSWT